MKRLIARIAPHLTIILSMMTLVFFSIDRVNPIMAFMTSELSKWVFAVLAVSAILTSVLLIGRQWKSDRRKARRHAGAAHAQAPSAAPEDAQE